MNQIKITPVSEIESAREAYQKVTHEKQIADFIALGASYIEKYIVRKERDMVAICTKGHWAELDFGCNQAGDGSVSDSAAKIALTEFRAAGYKTYMKTENHWLNEDTKHFIISRRPLTEYKKKTFWSKIELKEIK